MPSTRSTTTRVLLTLFVPTVAAAVGSTLLAISASHNPSKLARENILTADFLLRTAAITFAMLNTLYTLSKNNSFNLLESDEKIIYVITILAALVSGLTAPAASLIFGDFLAAAFLTSLGVLAAGGANNVIDMIADARDRSQTQALVSAEEGRSSRYGTTAIAHAATTSPSQEDDNVRPASIIIRRSTSGAL